MSEAYRTTNAIWVAWSDMREDVALWWQARSSDPGVYRHASEAHDDATDAAIAAHAWSDGRNLDADLEGLVESWMLAHRHESSWQFAALVVECLGSIIADRIADGEAR